MAAGETNYQIARLLGVSEATAKTHVKHVLAKLGAANRAEAVFRWLQHPQLGANTTQVLSVPQLTLVT